jgi:hypothetical protein
VSICAQPFVNSTAIKELNLSKYIWNLLYYANKNFDGWPIKNSTTDYHLWEQTTFGFNDIIINVTIIGRSSLNDDFQFEDSNSWLFVKVMKHTLLPLKLKKLNMEGKIFNQPLVLVLFPCMRKCV